MLLNHLLLLLLGLLGLWLGSELITVGASKIAKKMGLSETFIGLTVLAIGTDFPEIVVAFTGAGEKLQGHDTTGLVIGNIVGSTMSQISLVLGFAGLLKVFKMKKQDTMRNGLTLVIVTLLLFLLSLDGLISQIDGAILLSVYLVYFFSLQKTNQLGFFRKKLTSHRKKKINLGWPLAKLIIGLIIVAQASHVVVDNGVTIAHSLGVSQLLVGVLLIGIGTSLPELIVSLSAVLKGANGLSIGNLIGSNLIDVCLALGGSAMVGGWSIQRHIATFDLAYLLFTTVIVVLFLLTKQTLERKESSLILSLYVVYAVLKVIGF